jgi:peptidoglycan endopeptidase LytE
MVTIPDWFIRYGLPTAFLLAATVTVLGLRVAIHQDAAAPAVREQAPSPVRAVSPARAHTQGARASAYSVRSGDTLGTIADRFGTTVNRLLELNPGIDPRALRVGQPLRVD